MKLTRRSFLEESAVGAAIVAVLGIPARGTAPRKALWKAARIRIGGPDWSLGLEGKIGAFAVAKDADLDGIQVSLGGRSKPSDKLPMCDEAKQKEWLEESKKTGMPIGGTCLEILHRDNLKENPKGPEWVEQSIHATRALGTEVVLLPFFGKQQIKERAEQKAVAERLKVLAPVAEKAGVVLGLEDTISAEDNAWILDQVGSKAVKVYYDCGNSFYNKFNIYEEIVWLGKDRVCQLHLKDGRNLLGKGPIDYPRYIEAVLKSGFEGWAMLETSILTKVKDDFSANAAYVRELLKKS
jgi:sugar phosphate isomerase/epimerase